MPRLLRYPLHFQESRNSGNRHFRSRFPLLWRFPQHDIVFVERIHKPGVMDKLVDAEQPQLAEGPVEHGYAGITHESRREQKSVRLRHSGMHGRRQSAARRMVAVVRHRARRADPHRRPSPRKSMRPSVPVEPGGPVSGGRSTGFVLPEGYTGATAPIPKDDGIVIGDIGGVRVAVIRYSRVPGNEAGTPAVEPLRHGSMNSDVIPAHVCCLPLR